jgi:large subunit ribosomal protein L10
MATEEKVREVEEFAGILQDAQGVVLADFTGLSVASVMALRRRCRESGVHYKVVKNTLAKRALTGTGMEDLGKLLAGPNAWAVHPSDQVAAAKVIAEFAKDHEALKIRGGYMEGRVLTVKEIQALAKLPSREVLLSQVVRGMQGPLTGFAGVLTAVLRSFANVVDAYAKKRGEAEPAPAASAEAAPAVESADAAPADAASGDAEGA